MGANLTAVRAWTTEKRAERLPKFFTLAAIALAKEEPNGANSYELEDFQTVASALSEANTEETILVEETVTKASLDALQAVYDAYVLAHP